MIQAPVFTRIVIDGLLVEQGVFYFNGSLTREFDFALGQCILIKKKKNYVQKNELAFNAKAASEIRRVNAPEGKK